MTTDISLGAIKIFSATAKSGSFSAAARELNLTPSAVSQTMDRFESSIGLRLLDRSVRPMKLTSAGEVILTEVNIVLTDFKRLESTIAQFHSAAPKSLRLGVSELISAYAGEAITRTLTEHLDSLTMQTGLAPALSDCFKANDFDIAVTPNIEHADEYFSTTILEESYLVIVPKSFGLSQDACTLADLGPYLQKPFITYCPNSADRTVALELLRLIGLPQRISLALENTFSIDQALVNGLGWSILSPMGLWPIRDQLDRLTVHPLVNYGRLRVSRVSYKEERYAPLSALIASAVRAHLRHACLPELLSRKPCLASSLEVIG